ncbi:hypothetical protein R3P38DRAFT_2402283, partial [Favolaschia claudopus]
LTCPSFCKDITEHDIFLMQETHLRPNQHDSLSFPDGFQLSVNSRKYNNSFQDPWGGVLSLVNENIRLSVRCDLSAPDLTVLELDDEDLFIVNAYIHPEQSVSHSWAGYDPWLKYTETMALLQLTGKGVISMGDLNARTANGGGSDTVPRASADGQKPTSTRGTALIQLCKDHDYEILNGNCSYGPDNGRFTSFQPQGEAVVDYVIANEVARMRIKSFSVLHPNSTQSDHAAIVLDLKAKIQTATSMISAARNWKPMQRVRNGTGPQRGPAPSLPDTTELDRLFIAALHSKLTLPQKLAKLFGPVTASSNPVEIYVDGSCLNNGKETARAGAGVFWGLNHTFNEAARVPDNQTNNRGEVYAILRVLLRADTAKTLHIYSDSEYALETITERSPEENARRWKCPNGDLFRDIIALLKIRRAPVVFIQVKGHSGNKHNDAADELAKEGARMPDVPQYTPIPLPIPSNPGQSTDPSAAVVPKVSYRPLPKQNKPANHISTADHLTSLTAHRNRPELLETQLRWREDLLDAKTERDFWMVAKRIMNPKQVKSDFDAETLKNEFVVRMNPIEPVPESFDQDRLEFNRALAAIIPDRTVDETLDKIFSRPFDEEEMEDAKERLREHSPTSSRGYDQQSYADVCGLEN